MADADSDGTKEYGASTPTESNCPADTDFRQQRLKAWQPVLTPSYVIGAFIFVGIFFIPIGLALWNASDGVVEVSRRYDIGAIGVNTSSLINDTTTGQEVDTITVELTAPAAMTQPVYVYYGLKNFYQNHRRYVKSRNDNQLRGEYASGSQSETTSLVETACAPKTTIEVNGETYTLNPCGEWKESLL